MILVYDQPSKIHGVGTFAGRHIKKGEYLFVEHDALPYRDPARGFAGFNHSCNANVDNQNGWVAARDIEEGEELTTTYLGNGNSCRPPKDCNCGHCGTESNLETSSVG